MSSGACACEECPCLSALYCAAHNRGPHTTSGECAVHSRYGCCACGRGDAEFAPTVPSTAAQEDEL